MAVFKDVQDIADSMDSLVKIANFLASGSWTPQLIVRAYLTYGIKYGWNPSQCMENLHVMQGGKLAYQVHAFVGLALSSGKVSRFDVVESTDKICTIACQRKDSKTVHTISFTWDMAQLQGLTNSSSWKRMPKQMLQARCRTMAIREVFADVISGYDAVEMIDSAWDLTEEEKLKQLDEVQDTNLAEAVASEKAIANRKPSPVGTKVGADTKAKPQPQPMQVQPVQVQAPPQQPQQVQQSAPPPQPQQVQQSAPPKTQAPPLDQASLFPSDQKQSVEYQSYRDKDLRGGWADADYDEDDARDWRESWKIK